MQKKWMIILQQYFFPERHREKVLTSNIPVSYTHLEEGKYLGVVEVTQNIKPIQEITGEKRLVED